MSVKVKISEIPDAENLQDFYTIGTKYNDDGSKESVKMPLQFLEEGEDARRAAEEKRIEAEKAREAAEGKRASAEDTRQSNEEARQSAESARASAENTRESNEATRQSNEAARKSAENERGENEQSRQNAENARVGAETKRETAESNRVKAETARETASGEAVKKANDATAKATEAAALANEKATAADTAAGRVNDAITQANTAATNAQQQAGAAGEAAAEAKEGVDEMRAALDRLEELERTITAKDRNQPTSMALDYPAKITQNNKAEHWIKATLSPAGTGSNVLFLGDDKAVSVAPNGFISVNGTGKSRIHVIPTENTGIYRTIDIEVVPPSARLCTKSTLRLTSNGAFRFN